jgi:YHS domain-containing protein
MSERKDRHDRPGNDFKDPVCGMEVSRNTAAAVAEYKNETYFFCAPICRDRFLEDPEKYVRMESRGR